MDTDTKIRNIEQSVDKLKSTVMSLENSITNINRYISTVDKNIISDSIEDGIHDILWEKIFYVSSFASASLTLSKATTTVTIASPAVFTSTKHGLVSGNAVKFTTTGALPTGLTEGTIYYVITAGLTVDDFEVSTTVGGSAVNTSGTQSGTHSVRKAELLDANGRESDTSQGRKFTPDRQSRFKCSFYLNTNISKGVFYITSPAVSESSSVGTAILDANKSFVGIKIVGSVSGGAVNLVHSLNGTETTMATSANITDSKTNTLEIDYYISHFTVSMNSIRLGDMPCTISKVNTFETFFPFLTSVESTDGTSVNLTLEAFEFLQKRK